MDNQKDESKIEDLLDKTDPVTETPSEQPQEPPQAVPAVDPPQQSQQDDDLFAGVSQTPPSPKQKPKKTRNALTGIIVIIVGVAILGGGAFGAAYYYGVLPSFLSDLIPERVEEPVPPTQEDVMVTEQEPTEAMEDVMEEEPESEFGKKLQEAVLERMAGIPIEGFDADILLGVFPILTEQDFDGVEALQGVYRYQGGTLNFILTERPEHSAARAISEKGMETLRAALLQQHQASSDEELIEKISIDHDSDDDRDGLPYRDEILFNTDPNNPDTDHDSFDDGQEIDGGYNPLGEGKGVFTNEQEEIRQQRRDAKRIVNIKQIQTALELYLTTQKTYPAELPGGQSENELGVDITVISDAGVTAGSSQGKIYMGKVPTDPSFVDNGNPCLETSASPCNATYKLGDSSFEILFFLERDSDRYEGGVNRATRDGSITAVTPSVSF